MTDEALLLLRMDTDIALAGLASGRAMPVWAECGGGVHDSPPGFVWKQAKRSMLDPHFRYKCASPRFSAELPPPTALSFTLYFLDNSTEIMPDSRAILAALLAEVAKRQAVEVQITGHTDRVGKVEDNDRLSIQRAEAIRDVLIKNGLHASFIRAVGRGEREPLIPTPDEQAEPRNRRVEVIVR